MTNSLFCNCLIARVAKNGFSIFFQVSISVEIHSQIIDYYGQIVGFKCDESEICCVDFCDIIPSAI